MSNATGERLTTFELMRMFAKDRRTPEGFHLELATRAIESLPYDVAGSRVLDLGCGPGHYGRALERLGATVVATDLNGSELTRSATPPRPLVSDARSLPFVDGTFDGVFCSNILEHTPDPTDVIDDIARVTKPGGWAYVSWTNWYSPWGGHAIAPLHYLGPERGLRAWRRLFGEPKGHNLPYDGVWPCHIGPILDHVRNHPALELVQYEPRYYPSQRWVVRVPGLREVVTWNCLLHLRVRPT